MKARFYLVEGVYGTNLYNSIRDNNLYPLCFIETDVGEFILDLGCDIKENVIKSNQYRPVRINKCKVYDFNIHEKFIIEDEFGLIFRGMSIKTYSSQRIEDMFKNLTKSSYGWIASIKNLIRKFLEKEFKQ